MQRAGHSDFKTTQGYIRVAEAVRTGFGDVFPPLPPLKTEGPKWTKNWTTAALSHENICGEGGIRTRG